MHRCRLPAFPHQQINISTAQRLDSMQSFDFSCPTRIVFGPGKLDELGRVATELGAKRVLMVSDRGIIAAGHTPSDIKSLERSGISVALFDRIEENPTTAHVEDGLS